MGNLSVSLYRLSLPPKVQIFHLSLKMYHYFSIDYTYFIIQSESCCKIRGSLPTSDFIDSTQYSHIHFRLQTLVNLKWHSKRNHRDGLPQISIGKLKLRTHYRGHTLTEISNCANKYGRKLNVQSQMSR